MSEVKHLLNSLLWDIYGKQQRQQLQLTPSKHRSARQRSHNVATMAASLLARSQNAHGLQKLSLRKLIDMCAILKVEIRLMGYFLERVLISRDRSFRHQEILCGFVDAILQLECHDSHPKMRFSLSPPPLKASASAVTSPTNNNTHTRGSTMNHHRDPHRGGVRSDDESSASVTAAQTADDAASDYQQWLHAMKLVARLPGGMPPEFRRKLWLSLADKYLKTKNVDWSLEEEKCFCEKWREDDEELGIQIVKDLHRTGSNLCTGPAGSINQAKLKRILLGYARYNPAVGYCQGFNMLGALILQVMDKEEAESMKVMIYLVEGVLPSGYFCGSMGGLQADMGVFRDLMQTKLPRLAKHLQKLQGPIENAYEPPLTNVFTMQWFLTMFCTCLPMTCVLRVWDLVLIEGSDVLLRTALVLWSLLEERVLNARTADDFYCKMGSFSSELLNGHLIDSNGLIEKVVQLGAIPDIQKLRDKHLYNIAPLRHKQGLQLYFDDEEPESDEESRLAVATVWGIPWGRRGSHDTKSSSTTKQTPENKDRIALDISLLKKQYDRLRERQKQAHVILTTACSTARQGSVTSATSIPNQTVPVNQLLMGRPAIVTNRGRRIGPPPGTIPPARKPSLPAVLQTRAPEKQLRRGETLHWRDTDLSKRRRDSLTWKEIKADRASTLSVDILDTKTTSHKLRTRRMGKSDSSSYSEESDENEEEGSSTDTSLCDDDDPASTGDKAHSSSIENSPKRRSKSGRKQKDIPKKLLSFTATQDATMERRRPKSWAPTTNEIPFMLMTSDSPVLSGDEKSASLIHHDNLLKEEEDSATESDRFGYRLVKDLDWSDTKYSPIAGDLATTKLAPLHIHTDILELPVIISTSQLSPMPDVSTYLNNSTISPLPTPKPLFLDSTNSLGSGDGDDVKNFDVSDDGVINEYFERVNSVERPTKLDLFYSLNEEDGALTAYDGSEKILNDEHKSDITDQPNYKSEFIFKPDNIESEEGCEQQNIIIVVDDKDASHDRRMELFMDYSEKSSAAFIAEATSELTKELRKEKLRDAEVQKFPIKVENEARDNDIPGENRDDFKEEFNVAENKPINKAVKLNRTHSLNSSSKKRRDPRRLTLTRSTIDIEERFDALESRFSSDNLNNQNQNFNKDSNYSEKYSASKERAKVIPSTAYIEERYSTLERQHSIITTDNKNDVIKCTDEPKDKIKTAISESDTEPLAKQKRDRIPSTADLENRFHALEKQMSSNSLPSKNSIDLKCDTENGTDNSKTSKKETEEHVNEEAKLHKTKTESDSESNKAHAEKTIEHEKPRLTKLPSTAELEDRFNALERKMSIQKCSPSKSKKEPPDEPKTVSPSPDNKETIIYKKDIQSKLDEREAKEVLTENILENKKILDNSSDANENDRDTEVGNHLDTVNTQIKKVSQDKDNSSNVKANAQTNKPTSPLTKKKSPPSTEELEKRFQAFEKQLSTTSFDIETKDPKESSIKLSEANSKSSTEQNCADEKKKTKTTELLSADEKKTKTNTTLFEEKCKAANEKLSLECSIKECIQIETEREIKDNDENPQKIKSVQHFNNKCKSVNEELVKANELEKNKIEEKLAKELEKRKEQREMTKRRASEPPSTEDLEKRYESLQRRMSSKTIIEKSLTKSETVDEALERIEKEVIVEVTEVEEKNEGNTTIVADVSTHSAASEISSSDVKRKGKLSSEPPSTEDLENRFEALQQKHKQVEKEETQRENVTEKQKTQEVNISTICVLPGEVECVNKKVSSGPPSTEDLESRFEALQQKSTTKNKEAVDTKENIHSLAENSKSPKINKPIQPGNGEAKLDIEVIQNEIPRASEPNEGTPGKSAEEIKKSSIVLIPDAPPMPKGDPTEMFFKNNSAFDDAKENQRRALIEEFQSKIKTQPNDKNLKPSDINPKRKAPPAQRAARHNVDDTSETHADSAFYRSEYYEPWQIQQNRTVRRFSDLPSRADLENRLQFLEKQLAKKFYKQRCASDSEVASRRHFVVLPPKANDYDEMPSSSNKIKRSADDLENRVQALEKQLSENSLKLLEAMRAKTEQTAADCESPQKVSTETIDAAGKELVRYTHFGELEETESHKPINISINIKMLLNKDESDKKIKTEDLPTTEELEKRLEVLEQQIKDSRARGSIIETKVASEVKIIEKNENSDREIPAVVVKLHKDIVNKEVKTDSKDFEQKLDQQSNSAEIESARFEENSQGILNVVQKTGVTKQDKITKLEDKTQDISKVDQKTEVTKEEKTIENQEIARAKKAKDEEKKSIINEDKETRADGIQLKQKDIKLESKNDRTENERWLGTDKVTITNETTQVVAPNELSENEVINSADVGPVDTNNKALALLLDNEPKAVKVRRLTRANTEELEDLFQALEKQLSDRNLIKSDNGKLIRADSNQQFEKEKKFEQSKAISDLTKELEQLTSSDIEAAATSEAIKPKVEEDYDWGPDPVKRHLKRKTVHLPSTKELESRFRSLERQIKLLEDVENIDVEQRLSEIERKIKLQYSLSHERDLTKFLELCEGKGLDDYADIAAKTVQIGQPETPRQSPARSKAKSPHTSPGRIKDKTPYTSPTPTQERRSPYTSPSRNSNRSPYTSPLRQKPVYDSIPSLESLEYRYRILELPRSKSKDLLDERTKKLAELKKNAVHPIEMLLDASPDDNDIPITGELEHRMRILDGICTSPSPPRKSRSRSPTIDDIKRKKMLENQRPRTPIHNLERLVASPTRRELPTEDELEARMRALEQEQRFDFKMQKNFNEFNQKLKDVVSPSLSFEEFKASKSREQSPRRTDVYRTAAPKSALRDADTESRREEYHLRSTSPKVIRFREDEEYNRPKSRTELRDNERMVGNADGVLQIIEENSKMLHRILKKTLADSNISIISGVTTASSEGLNAMGSRLMRETSPITRTGTHTGVPLRTDDNINDRLNSIKNTIKSIDTLCEDKPYRKEKCQRYIDSLFTDSVYFASPHKKSSMDDQNRSPSHSRREYTPSIRVSDHSQRPSEYYLSRSMGSAESIRSTSPLRAASPLHYRSNRDIRRDTSPRRRRDEEREEYESRVRRENMLPNYFLDNHSDLSSGSLTKFHKVDRQLESYKYDEREKSSSRSASRSPLKSPYGSRETMMIFHTTNTATANTSTITPVNSNRLDLDRPVSPYRQTSHNLLRYDSSLKRSTTPVYSPAKLEIRHTTVTSTFYDRLLTEKQIEKNNLSRPPSRSPVVSPSVTSKSYLDIPIASATTTNTKTSNENSPTTTSAQVRGIMGTASLSSGSNYTFMPNYASSTHSTTTFETLPTYTTTSFNSFTTQYSATTPTGNSSTYQTALFSRLPPLVTDASSHIDLRIRSCDNILMQLKSTPTPTTPAAGANSLTGPSSSALLSSCTTLTATTPSATTNFASLYNPTATTSFSYMFPSSNNSTIIANTTTTTATTTTLFNSITSPYSTGAFCPLMPLTTRQPSDMGISLGLYTSTLNNTTDSSYGKSATELPKY